jgi:phosphoesterase RecJ-like protein
MTDNRSDALRRIRAAILERRRFLLSSHARPDGDAIGSQVALAFALRALGKEVRLVNRDAPPASFAAFPGVADIEVTPRAEGDCDAVIVLECGDLGRTGVDGLAGRFVINIDHHPGNTRYGAINWFDDSVSACGEMVFDVIQALGVPLSAEMATHVYMAILTDTGGFHFSGMTARTFEICRQAVEAGADPAAIARAVYDNNGLGRVKLLGSLLNAMELDPSGRFAMLYLDQAIADAAGATDDDTDGIINVPLTVGQVEAVAFFRQVDPAQYRVSLRSKGGVNVGAVAQRFGGGGHKNAAGCTVTGSYAEARAQIEPLVLEAIGRAGPG